MMSEAYPSTWNCYRIGLDIQLKVRSLTTPSLSPVFCVRLGVTLTLPTYLLMNRTKDTPIFSVKMIRKKKMRNFILKLIE